MCVGGAIRLAACQICLESDTLTLHSSTHAGFRGVRRQFKAFSRTCIHAIYISKDGTVGFDWLKKNSACRQNSMLAYGWVFTVCWCAHDTQASSLADAEGFLARARALASIGV
jgi:hypothetical protein